MHKPLQVLHLEDDADFAEVVAATLGGEGLYSRCSLVTDLAAFTAAIDREPFDVILADFSLPTCTGLDALEVARKKCPGTPFLLVSGTIGEEAAIESLRRGATDYVLKLWLERLVPAVRRAVDESRERQQRERAEAALAKRERYFRALTENSLDVLTILSGDGKFLYNSPSIKHVLGYDPEELIGTNAFRLVHPQDLRAALEALELALAQPTLRLTHEVRCRRRDKTWCYLEIVGQNRLEDPEIAGVVLNSRDITERKQAEARLRLQSAALESAGNAVVITNRAGEITWANSAFTRLTGYSLEEALGQNPRFLNSGQHDAAFFKNLWDTIQGGGVWHAEMVNRRKDGSLYTEEATITPVRGDSGEITHFVAVKQDITARKQAEQALSASERRFSEFMSHLPVAASIKDSSGKLVFANQYLQDVFGWKQWEGKTLEDLVPAAAVQRLRQGDHKALAEGPFVALETVPDAQGRERTFETYRFRIPVSGEQTLVGALGVDITQRKELEAQLRQAQKMEAIGQLAGGVAHDFNNLLTVIRGNADLALLLDGGEIGEKARQCMKQVAAATERSANLVRQLLTFSRKEVMKARALNLNEVIANLTRMLTRIIGENYELESICEPSLPLIHADPGMLEQVLVNLVVNARDSMPKGGQLAIVTRTVEIEDDYTHTRPESRAGRFVCLEVRDHGTGIAPRDLPRIFEPFFTTKEAGKGTGLGLATVYGIVKQHQGWIEVSTRVGAGTTFFIFLPAVARSVAGGSVASAEVPPRRGSEGILVVEDDDAVRKLTCQIIAGAGYRVWEASCAQEAIDQVHEHSAELDLMLTDIVMPGGISGLELVERLWRERPQLKVILMSGYSTEAAPSIQSPGTWTQSHFLEKPYPPAVLLQAIRRRLDEVTGLVPALA
jgi:two-component system cell cycle sensor histidine kinase/response regulator CckA